MSLTDITMGLVVLAFLFWGRSVQITALHAAKHGLKSPPPRKRLSKAFILAAICLLAAGILAMAGAGR